MLGRLEFYYIYTGFRNHVLIMKVSDCERFECREKMVNNVMGDIQTFLDVFQASEKKVNRSAYFYFSVFCIIINSRLYVQINESLFLVKQGH